MTNIALGISIGLIACCVQSLGLTIQRKSHVLDQSLPPHLQTVEYRRPLWLLGFAIFISSNIIGSFVQIASLPVVILAPLGAVSLLWNAFFARIILGDVFSPWLVLGTLLIAGGAVLIAMFGIVPEQTRSIEDLLELFRRPTFVAYFAILGATVVICLAITHLVDYSLARRHLLTTTLPNTSTISLATNGIEAVATERTPLLDPKTTPPSRGSLFAKLQSKYNADDLGKLNHTRLLVALSYASFSGILSGMCLLFAKSGIELLLLTVKGNNQFWRWEAWLLILGLVVFALLQMWYLQKALIFAGPTHVCPCAFCFYNLSSIVNGLVYFDQFSLIPTLHLILVSIGIVVLLAGVWVVSIQAGPSEDTIEESEASDTSSAEEECQHQEERPRIGAPRMERNSLSESDAIPNIIPELAEDLWQGGQDTRRIASHSYTSRQMLHPKHPLYRRTSIQLSTDAPLNGVGTGFQIGLSPMSPGFEIVPSGRRRRTTLLEGEVRDRAERRRTVSESDGMERQLPADWVVGKGKSVARVWNWKWW
ncbi:hypothetical protein JOM56_006057 [Amanita muscaria]